MKKLLPLSLLLTAALTSFAQPQEPLPLWPEGAPGALGKEAKDTPTLTAYLPEADKASGAAVVVCPGGGYGGLAAHEGPDYALFLNQHGVAAFVLKYRLGKDGYRHPAMLNDVSRALRLVRAKAADWKIDPKRVGVMGSSAGGHLASTVLTHFDGGKADATDPIELMSSRPDLGILCYPVISMGEKGHGGSRQNLLGPNPSEELKNFYSNEKQVTDKTPPCYLAHALDDHAVTHENSRLFADALKAHGVACEYLELPSGDHGLNGYQGPMWDAWQSGALKWLAWQKMIP